MPGNDETRKGQLMALVDLYIDNQKIGSSKKMAAPKTMTLNGWWNQARKTFRKELAQYGLYIISYKRGDASPEMIRYVSQDGRVGFVIDRTASSL
jgi:hypothetical protein